MACGARMLGRLLRCAGVLCVAWIGSTAAACGEDSCGRLSACDIRQGDCQARVMREVACLRGGGETRLPSVTVVSEGELLERYMSRARAETAEEQAERETNYKRWNTGLSLFRLAPADQDIASTLGQVVAQIGAVYYPDTKEILVVDRGKPLSGPSAVELLAHEVVHALQDAELDLQTFGEDLVTDLDSALALDAIVEGEATHYQLLIALMLDHRTADDINWPRFYFDWQTKTLLDAEEDAAPLSMADSRFPYAFGGALVSRHWLAFGRAGIDALFEHPPATTREVMFGDAGIDQTSERAALREQGLPVLADGYQPIGWTALGAWLSRMYSARMGVPPLERLVPSRGLAYDLFSVHFDPASDAMVAAWRVRTRAGFPAMRWPGLQAAGVEGWVDTARSEAVLVAARPTAPDAAQALAWQSPDAVEAASEGGNGTAAGIWQIEQLLRGRGTGCVLGRPPLRSRADTDGAR